MDEQAFTAPEVGKLYYLGDTKNVVEATEVTKRSVVFRRDGQFSHVRHSEWATKATPYWPTP